MSFAAIIAMHYFNIAQPYWVLIKPGMERNGMELIRARADFLTSQFPSHTIYANALFYSFIV